MAVHGRSSLELDAVEAGSETWAGEGANVEAVAGAEHLYQRRHLAVVQAQHSINHHDYQKIRKWLLRILTELQSFSNTN